MSPFRTITILVILFALSILPTVAAARTWYVKVDAIERTIFSFNTDGSSILLDAGATVTLGCCDLFGNSAGNDLPAGAVDNGNNFSADPEFCNPRWWPDPTLHTNSPCLPANHPDGASCDVIGARQARCNAVPVERRTWGHIKTLFR